MRNTIIGVVAGLAFGVLCTIAYSQYFGDGRLVTDLEAELASTKADLAKLKKDRMALSSESTSATDQINALVSSNEDLKKQLDDAKKAPTTTAAPINPMMLAGTVMNMLRGGGFSTQQRMFLLKSRLHLTPDQQTAIQAAMDADNKARRDLARQMFQNGGKVDPQAAANADSLDKTLDTVLSSDQKAAYQQVQADEQTSRANTAATIQVNQITPLLQLSDAQKDQVFNAVYQVQMSAPDPTTLFGNPNAMSVLSSQSQATQAALAKVLTIDQMALYQQQQQAAPQFGFGGRGGGAPANR